MYSYTKNAFEWVSRAFGGLAMILKDAEPDSRKR
jgi:hypothetical protein